MKSLNWNTVHSLLNGNHPPCISLFQPTHRRPTETQQDRVVYRNLLRQIEQSLKEKYPNREIKPLMEPFHALAEETPFWQNLLDGLVVLANEQRFDVYKLQRELHPLAIVADNFHLKPLIRYLQSADRYQVLCLNRDQVKMAEGNRYGLDYLAMGDFPATMKEALGAELTEPQRPVSPQASTRGGHALHYGLGSRKDEIETDTERFFRVVDREVLARFSKPSRLPLVLVSLAEHQPVFRAVSQNLDLLSVGVPINPDPLSLEELRQEVWKVIEPQYHQRLGKLCDDFCSAQAHNKGSADLSDVARAAVEGRIGTLLVEAFRNLGGRLDTSNGAIRMEEMKHPGVGDLIDDVAEEVLRRGGEVIVVPSERMPTKSGLAATFRF